MHESHSSYATDKKFALCAQVLPRTNIEFVRYKSTGQ